jgi:hypothetical protein
MRLASAFLVTSMMAGAAYAGPGDTMTGVANDGFELLHPLKTGRACMVRGAVCLSVGGPGTVAAKSPEVAAAPTDGKKLAVATLPGFARTLAVNGSPTQHGAWTIELDANLTKPALAGNAIFLFYDLEDPSSVENHEVTAMHQVKVEAGRMVAMRARLSPEDGFAAGHIYRMQVVQIIGGAEVVLAQGDFALR